MSHPLSFLQERREQQLLRQLQQKKQRVLLLVRVFLQAVAVARVQQQAGPQVLLLLAG
jgi:hypothetical protein